MCIALPGKVIEAQDGYAKVQTKTGMREVKFIDTVAKGDDVLISMGYIVKNKSRNK